MIVRDVILEWVTKEMKRRFLIIFIFVSLFFMAVYAGGLFSQDWKKEYEDICSKTGDPMTLTEDELRVLIERCDRLKAVIESLEDESTRRVYLKRLQMCRDLFYFCLEQKILKR